MTEWLKNYIDNRKQNSNCQYLWGKCGVYGLYLDDSEIPIYVGKSKNLLNRWIAHEYNTMYTWSPSYNESKYKKMREAIKLSHKIKPKVIELCTVDELNNREGYWIRYYMPKLNTIVPGGKRKQVEDII